MAVRTLAPGTGAPSECGASTGDTVVAPDVVVARLERRRPQAGPLSTLTDREYDTLGHMAAGLANGEIAERMFVTEKAVAKHINAIFGKLALGDEPASARRVQAVLAYLRR